MGRASIGSNSSSSPPKVSRRTGRARPRRRGPVQGLRERRPRLAKVENQIDANKRVADFLKAHVPPADCSCSLKEQALAQGRLRQSRKLPSHSPEFLGFWAWQHRRTPSAPFSNSKRP